MIRNRFLFNLIQWTWGFHANLLGLVVFLVLIIFFGAEPHKYEYAYYIQLDYNFDGFSLGQFIIVGTSYKKALDINLAYEYGHTLQNNYLGIFWLVIVGVPSILRYHYRKLKRLITSKKLSPYGSIWYERWVSKLGERWKLGG